MQKDSKKQIDWTITLVPLGIVVALSVLLFFMPEQSNAILSQIRFFFGDTFGTYYNRTWCIFAFHLYSNVKVWKYCVRWQR